MNNKFKGLFVFSITNLLERFGFYTMMSMLVLSFMEEKGFSGEEAGYYYSIFYLAIYASMLIMGLVGDIFSRRKVIFIGMILMAIGYFMYSLMSKESSLIIPGAFLILGLGAFKTNLQVQVGDLYKKNVKKGAIGYLIFFSFINIGAIFAPFAAVFVKNKYGIDSVFLLSGGATLLALALYYFVPVSTETEDELPKQRVTNSDNTIDAPEVLDVNESSDRAKYGLDKLIGLIFLILLVPFFWIAFHQNGLIYTFYVRDFIDLNGHSSETVQTINPIAFVLFSIIGVLLMYFFVKIKRIHSIFPFIGIGMIIVAVGYIIPAYGLVNLTGKPSYSYAIIPILIITLGELFISPFLILGFYHFSPARVRGLFMGLFMVITAGGNLLLYKYAIHYDIYGAAYTFKKIVFHVLISAAAVFLVWFLIKKISVKKNSHQQHIKNMRAN